MKDLCRQCLNPNEKGICTCGENKDGYGTPIPPVNESMDKECNCSFRFYGENKEKKCYGCGGSPIDLRDLEKAKRVFYDCFTETGSGDGYVLSFRADAEKAWQFIEILLSTARQEEREIIFAHLVKSNMEEFVPKSEDKLTNQTMRASFYIGTNAMLTILQRFIDSLTSKGGTNGL